MVAVAGATGGRRRPSDSARGRQDRVWVLTGDSELAEGSMWEAFEHAAFTQLDNLIAPDINRLGQTKATRHGWDTGAYAERLRAFGWHAIEIDGHDVDAINKAYQEAVGTDGRPTAIVARTVKGKGVQAAENRNGLHGKPLDDVVSGMPGSGRPAELLHEAGIDAEAIADAALALAEADRA